MLRKLAVTSAALTLLLLTQGCRTTGSAATDAAIGVATFCTTYRPVRWSKEDSIETVLQAKENNAVYKRLCM